MTQTSAHSEASLEEASLRQLPAALQLELCSLLRSSVQPIKLRLVFAVESKYVVRSDFLVQRLECCQGIHKVYSFLEPLTKTIAVPYRDIDSGSISDLTIDIGQAVGAIILDVHRYPDFTLAELDAELRNRLSYPWAINLPSPPTWKRLAWLGGRENYNVIGRAYEGARALGIKLVILDSPGHWLENSEGPYAYLREGFVPCSIEVTPDFTERVVAAVRSYPHPIDGLMTISDVRLPGVARACKILGLPTLPAEAYDIAGNKARSRMLEPDANEAFALNNVGELDSYLQGKALTSLKYPLIVKPTLGWNSDCVSKVSNELELREAVRRASVRHEHDAKPSTSVIVEPYISGPEVDANIFMLDGQVLFFECSDDFPSRGDREEAGMNDNFQETKVVMPSALPTDEQVALKANLTKSILRQGFTSGVFHCEARVRNSNCQYSTQPDGIFDLQEVASHESLRADGEIKTYLHEVNARPPGYLESVAVLLTYGVDYYALRMLLALDDPARPTKDQIRALSHPFLSKHQHHLSITIMPQTKVGIMKTPDAGRAFLDKYPWMEDKVVDWDTWVKGGEMMQGPNADALWWVMNASIVDRQNRKACLQTVKFMEESFSYEVEAIAY